MATQKPAYTFYADVDTHAILCDLPGGSRGKWICEAIKAYSADTSKDKVSPLDEAREVWAEMNKRIKRLERLAEQAGAC